MCEEQTTLRRIDDKTANWLHTQQYFNFPKYEEAEQHIVESK